MISVFTPLSASGNAYIEAAFETLKQQTFTDWEWIVVENHGGKLPTKIRKHPQVRCSGTAEMEGIGALKRHCCALAKGDILFEFDHDDLLHPEALEEAFKAIEAGADFAVSDFCEFKSDSWESNTYRVDCGWTSYPVTFQNHDLLAQPNPPITPQNLRKVEWSPNHLRAWRTEAYWKVGGHDASLPVVDDHDLIVRGYLAGLKYVHLPRCLYFYRVHAAQTVSVKNRLIQELDWQIYDRHITALAEKFADDYVGAEFLDDFKDLPRPGAPLLKVDLCGGIDPREGYMSLDIRTGTDLDKTWPLEDSSVGVIRAMDAIEHLKNPIHTMNEAYRVLAPGGFLLIQVPSTDGRGAFQDPTHVSFWNENSFWYYTRASHARYLPGYTGRFQISRLRSFFPSTWDPEANALTERFHRDNHLPYVEAHLIALKDGYAPMGEVMI